ncbi:hypothetical protein TNCV_4171321 [Trichonephila clavipes]|nr:hypothetical protein TNCV_4171321 [Trichonephila clavipes]
MLGGRVVQKILRRHLRINTGRAEGHARQTYPAVLMAEATIPVTTPIKEEKQIQGLSTSRNFECCYRHRCPDTSRWSRRTKRR